MDGEKRMQYLLVGNIIDFCGNYFCYSHTSLCREIDQPTKTLTYLQK